ncbi:MAG: hypothetical protein ICV53_01070 [Flavisolibacter sp.]|nr:hypothetical protein [Flavisolibacter sp.]MBD0364684.1 hypothetical protein [Flavisolibacter sp.]
MYLNCKTYFSYRYGVFSTKALVKEAVHFGAQALTLTYINCTADHWAFMRLCNKEGSRLEAKPAMIFLMMFCLELEMFSPGIILR